ncbi:bifunctional hydroxymethylpyrimidine kinase/phosphomethylpyrimidine kinase [Pseudochrobactrum sp. HB0163]|uniref:bifunctional hydroxymethylpyrimidine kinase/phosphomethylpyrimidine kinase n=1 Tax=Pseudochrobactrum sp. HB0163 TaxID=3450708 RepID=UPI003F6DBA4F
MKNVLSLAGSDPSGGAGIQADLKVFAARGTYGMAALTSLTAQNTQGVSGVFAVPAEFVAQQLTMIFSDVQVDAVKIGMIVNAQIADHVAQVLSAQLLKQPDLQIVLDPVMIAKGGASLLDPQAVESLTEKLLPLASLLTPNLPEAAALLRLPVAQSRTDMEHQGRALLAKGCKAVLMKGGHMAGEHCPDLLLSADYNLWFEAPRIATRDTHGTGCTLSSALAAELAKGNLLPDAVREAKAYLLRAISAAYRLDVGMKDEAGCSVGHGPVFHAIDQIG